MSDEKEMFAASTMPARKALVSKAAQIALVALVHDLSSPGVLRTVNYKFIRYMAGLEDSIGGHTSAGLATMLHEHHTHGDMDDIVSERITEYLLERQKFEGGR